MIEIGDHVPSGVLRELGDSGPETITTDKLLHDRTVVLFSCPGAFTPKSSNEQVPSYLKNADEIYSLGVDEILCVSVNDAFVMAAWGKYLEVGNKIRMLADGQCEFHTSMGLQLDCTRFALGFRSHRFSMIIEQGVVKELNLEKPGDYEVSGANMVITQLISKGR